MERQAGGRTNKPQYYGGGLTMNNQGITIKITSLAERQKEIFCDIRECTGVKYFALKCGRQGGKSFLLERIALDSCLGKGNQVCAFIMANEKQLKSRFNSMTKWLPECVILSKNKSAGNREIKFINGTILMFFTAGNPDSIASNSFDFIFADEFALWKREAWYIIKPTVSAKRHAKVVIVSTPRGINQFYDMYNAGLNPDMKRYKSYTMSYLDNPYYDLDDVEEARLTFSDAYFRQEYLAEFITGFSGVFGVYNSLQTIKEWEAPVLDKGYYFGIDCSGDGEDRTVLTIIDTVGKVVLIHEVKASKMNEQVSELSDIIKRYKNIKGYCEINGLGIAIYDLLIEKGINVYKWVTTNESKQELVSALILDLNTNNIWLPKVELCYKLDNEMSIYQATRTKTGKLTYGHPQGEHDDYVDSLMIANKLRHENNYFEVYEEPEDYDDEEEEDFY